MQKLKLFALVLIAALSTASGAAAQACLGLPSFATAAIHVNAGVEFADSATVYLVGVGAGKHNGLFANLGGFQVNFEGLDEKANFGFLEFGYQIPLGKAQVCPIASGQFGTGPDDDAIGFKVTTRGAAAGLALGVPLTLGGFTVVPNGAVTYRYSSQEVELAEVGSTTEDFNDGVVGLSLALIFRERFSIQPSVFIPFGGDTNETSFGVFASIAIGSRAR
jgi:hypothetical protein